MYAVWYKKMFGDIRYQIKVDDFKYLLSVLTEMLMFETDMDIINVHASISISAPPNCNEIVLLYKQSCRSLVAKKEYHGNRLAEQPVQLVSDIKGIDDTMEIFEIDDDD